MSSTIKVNNIQNLAGDDSGIDLSTNDQIILKTANTTALTIDSSQNATFASKLATTNLGAGAVLQVVSSTLTSSTNLSISTANTYVDTGITASITPSSTSNKILVSFSIGATGANTTGDNLFRLVRGSTDIAQGSGATHNSTIATRNLNSELSSTPTMTHLDSPSSTSSVTYKVQASNTGNSTTVAINRRQPDNAFCAVSNITLMEIAQ